MLHARQDLVGFLAQLAQIHLTVAETAFQRVFNRQRLLVDLFLHVVAEYAFISGVILHVRFDFGATYRVALVVKNVNRAAGDFCHVAFFKEHKAASHRQQGKLVRRDEVFTHAQTNHQRATRARGHQHGRIATVHHHGAISATQLRNNALNHFQQRTALQLLPMNQVSNNFGICFRIKAITAFNQQSTQGFVVFDNTVMHYRNVIRHMRVGIRFRRLAVGRPAGVRNTGAAAQRRFRQSISQHLHFTYATQTVQLAIGIDHCQTR